jgi:ABC-2 type transport system permease protein
VQIRWTWLLLPFTLIPLIAFASAVAMLVSSLFVRFRDVAPIYMVFSTALFYATPVLYPIDSVPDEYQKFVLFSPLAMALEQTRKWVIDPTAPGAFQAIGPGWWVVPIVIFFGTIGLAVWVFNREAPRIAERL